MPDNTAENLDHCKEAVQLINTGGKSNVLLVCEHASKFIPQEFAYLGLDDAARQSHVAWDPGAFDIACMLSQQLDATLVAGSVSRLIYDCNRPPESKDAMPSRSELIDIPGNVGLTAAEKVDRIENFYFPFRDSLTRAIERHARPTVLITIHSFTPVFLGNHRNVEVGFLHDSDNRLAKALLDVTKKETNWNAQLNQPYRAEDGVTHTLKLHGVQNNLLNVMLEIRNDLISSNEKQAIISTGIANAIRLALINLGHPGETAVAT